MTTTTATNTIKGAAFWSAEVALDVISLPLWGSALALDLAAQAAKKGSELALDGAIAVTETSAKMAERRKQCFAAASAAPAEEEPISGVVPAHA